ncbi:hypothetical protein [Paraburkholderia sp. SIMBA_030]|uniref:hypothetical protein n=1 Tax=Paraburkholderia sp. SIMBA_030 TaxID=3085773 RepID=UPI00397A9429
MKPVTVDMLRAHLMAASLTAMGAEALAWTLRPVWVAASCPRRWLAILHPRFTGRPFVLAAH